MRRDRGRPVGSAASEERGAALAVAGEEARQDRQRGLALAQLGEIGLRMLGLPAARVSVKATTTEGLGFTGRSEGIAAQAVVAVRLPAG